MQFQLKKKTYDWKDFFIIPFMCDAFSTIALGIQKVLTALTAVFQVVVLSNFINTCKLALEVGESWKQTIIWFGFLVICVGWRRISFVVGKIFINRLRVSAAVQTGAAFIDKLSRLHYSEIESEQNLNLIKRVCKNPENQVRLMLQRSLNVVLYIIRITGVLYIIFLNVWWIGIITALMCIPLILISLKGGERNYKSKKNATEYERRYQYLGEVLSGYASVNERTLFGFSDIISEEWKREYEEARKIKLRANRLMVQSVRGGSAIVTFFSLVISVMLLFPAAQGSISIGMCVALISGMYDLANMVGVELAKAVSQLSQCKEYLKDLSEFSKLKEYDGGDSLPLTEGFTFERIEFRSVTFSYPGTDVPILNNCSFTITKGNHYAFVGANGAGKTTIIKLLTGAYDNYDGEILVNGKELRLYLGAEIKALFCGVYQDFAKYAISVEDNILLGTMTTKNKENLAEKVTFVLEQVGLLEYVQKLPMGVKTPLGEVLEGGIELSGGQWQRLSMARAIISSAPVLILDEPTAALDPLNESKLYQEFAEICQGKTSLFISHRLGSTKLASTIFVLKDGYVAEEGSHEALMQIGGSYAHMYNMQRSWYK